jgi:methylthioribulose-1-phosphate dehydratase
LELPFTEAARLLIAAGQRLYALGAVPATSGNFSLRLAADELAITASGRDKSQLTEADILRIDLQGRPLTGGTPSAETGLHLQLYARDPAIGAVLHSHSLNAILACRQHGDAVVFSGLELLKAFNGISSHEQSLVLPVFENDQDIAALAARVDAHMQGHSTGHAYLIRGHGLYTWGADLEECLRHSEALEFLFAYDLEARRLAAAGATK